MKRKLLIPLIAILLSVPTLTMAQRGGGKNASNTMNDQTVFVNTEAPGVHKEYDSKRGCYVWKNGMGSFICLDKEMKPIWEMDKQVYFTGSNNDPDNPEVSPYSGIKKVWDKNRGCYVWKNVYTGDFLGTDKASVQKEEKKKEMAEKKQQQKQQKQQQKQQEKTEKQQQQSKDKQKESVKKSENMLITTDEQLREAEAALKEAKAMYAAAKAEGMDLSEYNIDAYIKQAEDAINEYKRARNKMK